MNINERRILNMLGSDWEVRSIEGMRCIYRNMGIWEIVITGGKRWNQPVCVYVCKKQPYYEIVDRHLNVRPFKDDLKGICEKIVQRFEKTW